MGKTYKDNKFVKAARIKECTAKNKNPYKRTRYSEDDYTRQW